MTSQIQERHSGGPGAEPGGEPAPPGRHRKGLTAGAVLVLLGVLTLGALLTSLAWGGVSITPRQIVGIGLAELGVQIGSDHTAQQSAVLLNIRLPRALMSLVLGAALALAGSALQVAFRNQLADPTLLGLSGAATLGVVVAYAFGLVRLTRYALPVAAVLGAVVSVLWLMRFARRLGRTDRLTVILSGVALQLFLAGVVTLLVNAVRRPGMPDANALNLGGLTGVFWRDVAVAAPLILLLLFVLTSRARLLNILLLDDGTARALGVDVDRSRLFLALASAVATGTVVGYGGSVAFVGLVVPFIMRKLVGDDHRLLLPAAFLGGAALVGMGDALARNVIAPMELPVGVLMTLVGGPLFFWLISRGRSIGNW